MPAIAPSVIAEWDDQALTSNTWRIADSTAKRVLKTLVHIPIWNLKIGDVIVTPNSNTRRKILEREGNTFRFRTTQEFTGHTALNFTFYTAEGEDNLTKEKVLALPLGKELFGPKGTMKLVEIKNNGSTAVFSYEETQTLTQKDLSYRKVERLVA